MAPGGSKMASRRLPGASWSPGRALDGQRGGQKFAKETPGGPRGGPEAIFCPVSGFRGRPGVGPGRLQELIFEVFWECRRGRPTRAYFRLVLELSGVYFYAVFGALLPSLLRARRRREHGKTFKNHWVLWVVRHVRLFRATREETEFQRIRVAPKKLKTF